MRLRVCVRAYVRVKLYEQMRKSSEPKFCKAFDQPSLASRMFDTKRHLTRSEEFVVSPLGIGFAEVLMVRVLSFVCITV